MKEQLEKESNLEEDTQKGRFLTFVVDKESYGIEIGCVTEIIGIQAITAMPEFPEYIRGIINLRGKVIPVMDLRLRFKKEFRDYNERTCVIVVDINDLSIGLIVDAVAEVIAIAEQDIGPPPQISNVQNRYIKAVGKVGNDIKLILDCEQLLSNDELNAISKAI